MLDRHDDGEVSEKPQIGESGRHDGDVQNQTAGNDAGGGDRDTRDREPVPLKPEKVEQFEEELNRELEDLDSFGEKRETVYEQMQPVPLDRPACTAHAILFFYPFYTLTFI